VKAVTRQDQRSHIIPRISWILSFLVLHKPFDVSHADTYREWRRTDSKELFRVVIQSAIEM
jgi:hypothetical protein